MIAVTCPLSSCEVTLSGTAASPWPTTTWSPAPPRDLTEDDCRAFHHLYRSWFDAAGLRFGQRRPIIVSKRTSS